MAEKVEARVAEKVMIPPRKDRKVVIMDRKMVIIRVLRKGPRQVVIIRVPRKGPRHMLLQSTSMMTMMIVLMAVKKNILRLLRLAVVLLEVPVRRLPVRRVPVLRVLVPVSRFKQTRQLILLPYRLRPRRLRQ